ncbi:MAG TPA: aldehyde dehydrogenase family protein [Streptosporangiaceae bacterium]|nr:aldehyde dehydrogenase family protein [Streptosporangiaceae bacterium]
MSEAKTADAPPRGDVPERGLLIGGKSVPASSGKLADDVCPWDGELYARVAAGTPADITRAADAAQAAFPGWSQLGAFERREIFLRAADVMASRGEEAIVALARETGASRLFAEFNLAFCIQVLREAAAACTRPVGELLPTSIPGAYSMAQRIPFGVVGAISPWNAPLVLGIRSIAIPLAVGNTVVMKPSEDAPVTCGLLLADVLTDAGLPAGVLNVVTNDLADAGEVVAALIADPRVRMVNFTGSTGVGRIIGVQAAQHLKPAVLELGGKNPLIILEDADPDLAVDAAVFGAFMNSGQLCMSTDRIIIHQSLVERFIPRYVERVTALPAGDPADPATIVGPLINRRGAQRVSALVKDAAAKGATLLTGDGAIGGPNGTLIRPVVLTDVTTDMDIFAAEIFGPATVIHPVDSAEAAIELANDTEYGLTGGVISRDLNAALNVVARVRSGIIHVNDQGIADEPMAPFGGVQNTGYGRFGGTAGIESFTEQRWVTIQHTGRPAYPF